MCRPSIDTCQRTGRHTATFEILARQAKAASFRSKSGYIVQDTSGVRPSSLQRLIFPSARMPSCASKIEHDLAQALAGRPAARRRVSVCCRLPCAFPILIRAASIGDGPMAVITTDCPRRRSGDFVAKVTRLDANTRLPASPWTAAHLQLPGTEQPLRRRQHS